MENIYEDNSYFEELENEYFAYLEALEILNAEKAVNND